MKIEDKTDGIRRYMNHAERQTYMHTHTYIHTYIPLLEWRSFHNELRTSPQRHTIDGDLVERILDMDKAVAEVVAGEVSR